MKIGAISDIHSNLPALDMTLDFLIAENVDKIYSLGDQIGYGPYVNECLDLLQKQNIECLRGNHEGALLYPYAYSLNRTATEGINYTKEKITIKNQDYLKTLDHTIVIENIAMIHEIPDLLLEELTSEHSVVRLLFPDSENDSTKFNKQLFEKMFNDQPVVFFGHKHIPFVLEFENYQIKNVFRDIENLELDYNNRYLINTGGVGHSRDGNREASFVIYNTESKVVHFYRNEYDISKMEKKMKDEKFHQNFIDRFLEAKN